MAARPKTRVSIQEYLVLDRTSNTRLELINGEIVATAGASRAHNVINHNLGRDLGAQLLDRPCEIYASDMRVHVSATGDYAYPDQIVVCGDPQFVPGVTPDTLLNPTVIFEVLSPTTASYDRGDKFDSYRELASLQDYVLIAQDRCRVVHYTRSLPGEWRMVELRELSDRLELPSIACSLLLTSIYAKVTLHPTRRSS